MVGHLHTAVLVEKTDATSDLAVEESVGGDVDAVIGEIVVLLLAEIATCASAQHGFQVVEYQSAQRCETSAVEGTDTVDAQAAAEDPRKRAGEVPAQAVPIHLDTADAQQQPGSHTGSGLLKVLPWSR